MSPILSARGGMSAGAYGWGAASGALVGYESISTTTLSTNQTTVTLSLSGVTGFEHLQIRMIGRTSAAGSTRGNLRMRLNSDSGTNYSWHYFAGIGSSTFATGGASATEMRLTYFPNNGWTTGLFGVSTIDILQYASTSKYKTVRAFGGDKMTDGSGYIGHASGTWRNTAAITSIAITHGDGDWLSGSEFALYGIRGAA